MPSPDDPLDRDFTQLEVLLHEPAPVSATAGDPFYYFVFAPEQVLEVRRRIPVWAARLRNAGLVVEIVSFSDLLWDLIDASGRWDEWLENEQDFDQEDVNAAIRNVLRQGTPLVERVGGLVDRDRPATVLFLTDAESLHPYFRLRTLESSLHDRVRVPTVVFYPGRRVGQHGLRFLDFYPEDNNYRSTIIGGLP